MSMFKFLNPSGCTEYEGESYAYILPRPDQTWGDWMDHPNPGVFDGRDCGPGGWHLMKTLDAHYGPANWWPWWAEGRGLLGESVKKARYTSVRLRRITPRVFWRMLRPPFNYGCGADLRYADLRDADLRYADLRYTNLRYTNLRYTNLRDADLRYADLRYADLRGANLRGANLRYTDFGGITTNKYTQGLPGGS